MSSVKHLGTTITDVLDEMSQDIQEKRALYIAKNNELMQEFYFAHSTTIAKLNTIYNTHFYGAPLWDLFSRNAEKLVNTWNTSNRIMYSLPRTSHRYLIEPISERPHIILSLWKRFVKFTKCIAVNGKDVLRNVFNEVKSDCRSITGRNLRNIMLWRDLDENNDAGKEFSKVPYYELPNREKWRVALVKEISDANSGSLKIDNFNQDEINLIKEFACCS